jgi:hypothetical protein
MTYNNDINAGVTGLVKGSGTGTFSGVTVTQYNSLIGATSNGITSVAPSSTSGVPLVSNGSSANPSYTTMVVGGGGTGITSGTAYGVVCAGTTSTGAFQVVTPGTAGYLLESGGASALPTWVSVGSGGNLVLIQSQTVSTVSSVVFTTGITSTYNNYFLVATNVISDNSSTVLSMIRISTNGGSTYISSGYYCGEADILYNSATWGGTSGNHSNTMLYGPAIDTNTSYFNAFLYNLTSGSGYVECSAIGVANSNGVMVQSAGAYNTASTTVNAFQVLLDIGNISGTFTLFGILQ